MDGWLNLDLKVSRTGHLSLSGEARDRMTYGTGLAFTIDLEGYTLEPIVGQLDQDPEGIPGPPARTLTSAG